ncbi:actin cytoskeleton-regulatory complex protein End3p [[Candida] anglica]|uniref:Actin cytoskeleton-regulatory complex protein END3 n=1 Tax=[Candida] anglica TaxID=148631 RepID=A0ABP0EGR1_9ASCO
MPRLEDWEIKKYWEIFQGLNPESGKLTGERVSPVLKNSRLSDEQLGRIWQLSDIDSDGKLDFEEFCITMRLIFDLVNGNQQTLPQELPSWLIPASKAHLIQANRAVATGNNNYKSNYDKVTDDDDEDEALSDDFDWYISPTDRSTYESIYNSNSDTLGRVRFDSLNSLYSTLTKVPRADISSAWNLVNPKSFETIDKDQVLVFLHILNQRENGKRVPRGVPASLRATFSKEQPSYDLSQSAAQPQKTYQNPSANNKKAFGDSYLSKIGMNHNSVTGNDNSGTDFSSTKDKDWEEVRLRRELTNLEDLLSKAQSTKASDSVDEESALIKHELELLLRYKEEKLRASTSTSGQKDLGDVKNDIDEIETQVNTLEEFLKDKKSELATIQQELASLKA